MDGAVPLPEAQVTTVQYVHSPLPGPRWIRVLALQPASNLEDALVGSFNTVSLGEPLPSEPDRPLPTHTPDPPGFIYHGRLPAMLRATGRGARDLWLYRSPEHLEYQANDFQNEEVKTAYAQQKVAYDRRRAHLEHVIRARQSQLTLCYDALSYTWATESGDASLSHSMLLDGRRLGITQNLAEGLRRLRSCVDPKSLWVDAICIDQSNLSERSAQVAIMFDIYRLAQNLVVWLGEGEDSEDNHIAWQWTRCIDDVGKRMQHGNTRDLKLREIAIAILQVETCQPHPSQILEAHSLTAAPNTFQVPPPELDRHLPPWRRDGVEPWLAADPQRIPLLVTRLVMFLSLLKRKYWKRYWIIQENFSRMSSLGAKTFHWGRYSTDAGTLLEAINVILSIVKATMSFPSDYNSYWAQYVMRLARFADEPYQRFISSIRRILVSDEARNEDLLGRIREFRDFQCADPRDRLYSLLATVPGHRLQADYTATFETVCARFAKSMVDRGDLRVLHYAGLANNPTSTLPSWAADLRVCHLGSNYISEPVAASTRHQVNTDMSLTLDLHWVGQIADGSAKRASESMLWGNWVGEISRNGVTFNAVLHFETRKAPVPKKNDVLCMLDLPPTGRRFLWLRQVESAGPTYRLVVFGNDVTPTLDPTALTGFSTFLRNNKELLQRSKVSVTIV